jgi:hypothetical protein
VYPGCRLDFAGNAYPALTQGTFGKAFVLLRENFFRNFNGGRTRTRTLDPLIKSQLLLQKNQGDACKGSNLATLSDQRVRDKV